MKRRICRRYNPSLGTWYVIQKKVLFWWHTYNIFFHTVKEANQYLKYAGLKSERICETPLDFTGGEFVDPWFNAKYYPYMIRLK